MSSFISNDSITVVGVNRGLDKLEKLHTHTHHRQKLILRQKRHLILRIQEEKLSKIIRN
jgi:hypothetical protein